MNALGALTRVAKIAQSSHQIRFLGVETRDQNRMHTAKDDKVMSATAKPTSKGTREPFGGALKPSGATMPPGAPVAFILGWLSTVSGCQTFVVQS